MSHKWPCINLNPQWQTQKSVIQYILEYYFSNILNAPPSFRFISPYRAFPKLSPGWRTGDCLCSQQLSFSNTGEKGNLCKYWLTARKSPLLQRLFCPWLALPCGPHLPLANRTYCCFLYPQSWRNWEAVPVSQRIIFDFSI